MLSKKVEFTEARPVWAKGYTDEMNICLQLTKNFTCDVPFKLRITCHSAYQIFLGDELFAMGPARAGHGYCRVDEYLISKGSYQLKILVSGYNNNSFYWIDRKSFVCCELVSDDGNVIARTNADSDDFNIVRFMPRVQKIQRFSFQRNFAESYDFTRLPYEKVELVPAGEDEQFIERGIPYYGNDREMAKNIVATGTVFKTEKPVEKFMDRSITNIGPLLKGFTIDQLESCTVWELQEYETKTLDQVSRPNQPLKIPANNFAVYEMEKNLAGLIEFTVKCDETVTIFAGFDEIIDKSDMGFVSYLRLGTSSVVKWILPKGTHKILTFEPYVYKYLKIYVLGGDAVISDMAMRRVGFYKPELNVLTDNEKLKAVCDAAVETFRQNTYDVYSDCASRERAGWLCDSYFTSRVEYALTGKTLVERNFLENFLLPDSFKALPKGMLPMCYPGDQYNCEYIPSWAMFYVLELEEYYDRSGDNELVAKARTKVYDLLNYFRKFENNDGLLEKLEGWVFVEWSEANNLVQDLNFPNNMLYARMKKAIASLYKDEKLEDESERLADVIRKKSFTGKFFCDNMVYNEKGELELSMKHTECCQYYAFHTGVATPELYPELWETLVKDFGPSRKVNNKYPDIYFANAFIGNYLRLDLLMRYGLYDEVKDNIEGYLYYMAEKTGTLWENDTTCASCSHGFASHVLVWMFKLGLISRA